MGLHSYCAMRGNRNNSILVKTIGVKSNRDGIGARVKVVSAA